MSDEEIPKDTGFTQDDVEKKLISLKTYKIPVLDGIHPDNIGSVLKDLPDRYHLWHDIPPITTEAYMDSDGLDKI